MSTGQRSVFPEVLKPSAQAISKGKTLPVVLTKYAGEVFANGYPKRSADVYVDKVASWVKQDKELMAPIKKDAIYMERAVVPVTNPMVKDWKIWHRPW